MISINTAPDRDTDLWGALASSLVALPASIAFGFAVFAPLGTDASAGAPSSLAWRNTAAHFGPVRASGGRDGRLRRPDNGEIPVLLSLDTLKTCVVVDALTGARHESNRELFGQGAANTVSALIRQSHHF